MCDFPPLNLTIVWFSAQAGGVSYTIRNLTIRNHHTVIFAVLLALVLGIFTATYRLNRQAATATTERSAAVRAQSAAALIASEFQKYRMLPLVLSDYPDVQTAVSANDQAVILRLNQKLEQIARRTDATVIYVINLDGTTIAASNWRSPDSFVGQNYGFRPYFRNALNHESAEQFALGTVSGRPGLFLAHKLTSGRGVVVVKVEFEPIEGAWAHQAGPTIVRDANGVVIMASRPAWRMRATRKLNEAQYKAISAARLYGSTLPTALAPDLVMQEGASFARDSSRRPYKLATLPITVSGWTLSALEPLAPAYAAADAKSQAVGLVAALLALLLFGLLVRSSERKALRLASQQELESQVKLRTAELLEANKKLVQEYAVRERNEARLRAAREELAQSNRLATLGQITAGVSHEINQPLAALRTFAENAIKLIAHGKWPQTRANIEQIVELSARIGEITGELRSFARRDTGRGPVCIGDAIDGALMLVGDRLRQMRVSIRREGDNSKMIVAANRVTVEQILINLLQNALDALEGLPDPAITIQTATANGQVTVTIADNGPGISTKGQKLLFKSFATQKPDGLGLGLVISRELAREVGGELIFAALPERQGATFVLQLPEP